MVTNAADRDFIEKLWDIPKASINPVPGTDAVAMFAALESGAIKAVWIICTNPVASMPNRSKIIAGLQAAELVIAQDAFLDTETNAYADVLLPGALWAEASGVMINSERNMTLMQQASAPPGEARADWQIIAQIACAMGYEAAFSYSSAAEIFDEIRRTTNAATGYDISGATHEALQAGPLQWPIALQGAARNPIRYRGAELRFPTASGRARFFARPALGPAELPGEDFPFVLNTGRVAHQWHTMTKTGKIRTLNKLNPGPFVEINPEDAAALGVVEGDQLEITSRRGRAVLPAVVTTRVLPGSVFAPFHWNDVFGEDLAVNAVTNDAVDETSLQPAFKFCAVALRRIEGPAGQPQEDRAAMTTTPRAHTLAAALDFTPAAPPALNEVETIYVSGFIRGLDAPERRPGVPVLPENAPLSPAVRLWVNGVLAGVFCRLDTAGGAAPPADEAPGAAQTVTLLWASQTGNSEALAAKLEAEFRAAGIIAQAICMDDYLAGELGKPGSLIFISSTYGDGEPPDNGRGFWEFLSEETAPKLEHLQFAVCGLGDSSYDQFCQHGKNLDARLAALGAQRLAGRLDCDADHEPEIGPWLKLVIKRLNGAEPGTTAPAAAPAPVHGKNNPYPAKLLASTRLNGSGTEKETRFVAFGFENEALRYEAGDALGIWPSNCPALVDEVLHAAGLANDAMVAVDKAGHLPLRQALLENFELTRPSRETLEFIAERNGSAALKALLTTERRHDLKHFLWGKQLPDVLAAFPIHTTAQEFASALKHIQPRLYSIASSPSAHAGQVHLTVAAVRFGAPLRKGACSAYLAERAAAEVPIFIQSNSHFRLPADPATPVIMIGPGTGIAPFRGFLHERRAQGASGRNWLFFGERNRTTDFYYEHELAEMRNNGHLTELSLAFSRDQAEKIYVQHLMLEQGAKLWSWLQDGASLYVCGDATHMARDVEAALLAIVERHGSLARDTAQDYVKSLAREKRYLRDVY
jgi:sulfite reductase (NADPH) flavoprotein alpha-component